MDLVETTGAPSWEPLWVNPTEQNMGRGQSMGGRESSDPGLQDNVVKWYKMPASAPSEAGTEPTSQTNLMTLDKQVLFLLKAAENHQFAFHHCD